MQLLGADIDIAGKDVVHNDVLDERTLIVLFFIIGAGAVEGDGGHGAQGAGLGVLAVDEYGKFKMGAVSGERTQRHAAEMDDGLVGAAQADDALCPFFTNDAGVGTGHDAAVGIDHTDPAIGCFFHLKNDILEHAAGHGRCLLCDRFFAFLTKGYSYHTIFCPFLQVLF